MNTPVSYEGKLNKQIAEFAPELAKELKAGIEMVAESALVTMDQGRVMVVGYLSYGGKFVGKKGDRHDYDVHVAWREDASEIDYAYMLVRYRHFVMELAEQKKQRAELRIFVDMASEKFLDKLYQMGYGFGGTWLVMKRGDFRPGIELNPRCGEEYVVSVCTSEEFEEYMSFYGREDLRESIQNKLTLGGSIYLGRLNGKLVSAAIACPRDTVEISDLFTAEEYRECHYARDLVACLIKEYRAKRKKVFTFRTKAENYAAIYLAQALSFMLAKTQAEMYRLTDKTC